MGNISISSKMILVYNHWKLLLRFFNIILFYTFSSTDSGDSLVLMFVQPIPKLTRNAMHPPAALKYYTNQRPSNLSKCNSTYIDSSQGLVVS